MDNAFDLEEDRFADPFLMLFGNLHTEEERIRQMIEQKANRLLIPNRIFYKSISKEEEIIDALVYMFGRRKGIL